MFDTQAISNFLISLEIMGLGMAGIFSVILLVMGVVALLGRIGAQKKEP